MGCGDDDESRSQEKTAARGGCHRSVAREIPDRLQDVGGLRKNRLFEERVVGHGRVERGHAADRGIEVLEEVILPGSADVLKAIRILAAY